MPIVQILFLVPQLPWAKVIKSCPRPDVSCRNERLGGAPLFVAQLVRTLQEDTAALIVMELPQESSTFLTLSSGFPSWRQDVKFCDVTRVGRDRRQKRLITTVRLFMMLILFPFRPTAGRPSHHGVWSYTAVCRWCRCTSLLLR